jgi:hypothetical protein
MFNLQEKIAEFKGKHFKDGKVPAVTQQLTADLLAIQREAVENDVDVADIDALSDEIFGEAKIEPPPPKKTNEQRSAEDITNKAKRELEATQNLAVTKIKSLSLRKIKTKNAARDRPYEKVRTSRGYR